MWRPRPSKCAPFEGLFPWAVGLPEAAVVGAFGAVFLSLFLGWQWGIGLLWGMGEIALGRLISWAYYPALKGHTRVGLVVGFMAGARLLLYGALAALGIALSLEPLGICAGLLLPGFVLKMRLLFGFRDTKCSNV